MFVFLILKCLYASTSISALRVCVFTCVSELEIWVFETIYSGDARHFEYISLQLGSHSGRSPDDTTVLYFFFVFFCTCESRVHSMRNSVI